MLKTSHGHLSLRTDMQAAESRISSKTTGVSTLNFVNKILFHKIEAYDAIMKLGGLPNMKKSTNAACILISPVNCMPPLRGWQVFGLKFERGSAATAHPCISFFSRNKPSGSTHCSDLQCSPSPGLDSPVLHGVSSSSLADMCVSVAADSTIKINEF